MRRVEPALLTAMKTPLPVAIASSLLMFLPVAGQAQSLDDVHLTPRGPLIGAPTTDGPSQEKGLASASNSLHVNVDVVLVPVTVTDEHNRSVIKLDRSDFALFEQNKRQDIRYFSAEDEPLSVAVLFDVSKSMTGKLETERAALVEFFRNANPEDEYFAITFSDRPRIIADSTRSIDVLESKLLGVQPGGPTAMLDAISLAEAKLRHARYQRKAIVIFSDGGDNASQYTLREIKALVEEADVQVYAVGLFDTFFVGSLEEKLGKRWLSDITDRTGGRTLTVDNCAKLPQAAAALSREMRNQYILGYRPENIRSSGWRKIRIVATEPLTQKSLHANYKKGYLASSTSSTHPPLQ